MCVWAHAHCDPPHKIITTNEINLTKELKTFMTSETTGNLNTDY